MLMQKISTYVGGLGKNIGCTYVDTKWVHIIPMLDVPAFSHHKECDWLTSRRYYKFYFDLSEE